MKQFRIGTRGSPLALIQTHHVLQNLKHHHPDLEYVVVPIKTEGDTWLHTPLRLIGGKDLFTRLIDQALVDGSIDLAVHSLKDVPCHLHDQLSIGAVLEGDDPRDTWISDRFPDTTNIHSPIRVGTSSLRRQASLAHFFKNKHLVEVIEIRGNVGSRLEKMKRDEVDALVLAVSGLKRLELKTLIHAPFSIQHMVPAVGQGVISVLCRHDDHHVQSLLSPINHTKTRKRIDLERKILRLLNADCYTPIGIHVSFDNERPPIMRCNIFVGHPKGDFHIQESVTFPENHAEKMAHEVAMMIMPTLDRLKQCQASY